MGWKIFFWIYLLFALFSFLNPPENPTLIEILGYPGALLELVALYSFAFKKHYLTRQQWWQLMWVYIGFNVLIFLGEFTPLGDLIPWIKSTAISSLIGAAKIVALIMTVCLLIPILYVFNRLSR